MDPRGRRPPRSARPPQSQGPPSYQNQQDTHTQSPPPPIAYPETARGVSFQNTERGHRQARLDDNRQHAFTAYQPQSPNQPDATFLESGAYSDGRVGRKKSMVRPDREKIEPGHRQWHYRNAAAQLQNEGGGVDFMPSSTFSQSSEILPLHSSHL